MGSLSRPVEFALKGIIYHAVSNRSKQLVRYLILPSKTEFCHVDKYTSEPEYETLTYLKYFFARVGIFERLESLTVLTNSSRNSGCLKLNGEPGNYRGSYTY